MTSVTGFTIASLLCGLAPNLPLLVVFRLIQGATGGAMQPLSQAVLLEAFPPEERGKAMGFWGLGIVVAPILGPVLGGWLTDTYSWRWVFYINLPVGIVSLVMTKLLHVRSAVPADARPSGSTTGASACSRVWVGALQLVLDKGQEDDWFSSQFITTLAVISGGGARRVPGARVDGARAGRRSACLQDAGATRTGVFLMTTLGFVLYGSLVLLPILLQTLLGYPSLQAGIAMAPRGMGSFIGMPLDRHADRPDRSTQDGRGRADRSGRSRSSGSAQLNLHAGYWDIFWPQFLQGLALSALFVPLTTISMDPIPRERMGNATSLFNLMRNLGGSIGIATTGTLLARKQQEYFNVLRRARRSVLDRVAERDRVGAAGLPRVRLRSGDGRAARVCRVAGMVQQQAAMVSFVHVFRLLGIIFLLLLPLVLLMRRPRTGTAGRGALTGTDADGIRDSGSRRARRSAARRSDSRRVSAWQMWRGG